MRRLFLAIASCLVVSAPAIAKEKEVLCKLDNKLTLDLFVDDAAQTVRSANGWKAVNVGYVSGDEVTEGHVDGNEKYGGLGGFFVDQQQKVMEFGFSNFNSFIMVSIDDEHHIGKCWTKIS